MLHKESDAILELRELLSKSGIANTEKTKTIEELQNAAKEAENQHNELLTKEKNEYAILLEHCNNLQSALQIITNNEAAYRKKIEELSEEVGGLRSEKENLSTEVAQIRTEKENLSTEAAQIRTEKENLSTEVVRIRTEKENLSAEVVRIRTEKESLSTEVAQIRSEKESLSTNQSATDTQLNQQLIALQKENEQLQNRINMPHFRFDIDNSVADIFRIAKRIRENENNGKFELAQAAKQELIQFLPTICKLA